MAKRIIAIATDRARLLGFCSVSSVRVRIGEWACINVDLLQRAFEAACRGSGMPDAQLHVELVKPICQCEDCGAEFGPVRLSLRCTVCGSAKVVLQAGRELEVESIGVVSYN